MIRLQRLWKRPACAWGQSTLATSPFVPKPVVQSVLSRSKSTIPSNSPRVSQATGSTIEADKAELEAAKRIKERDVTDVYPSRYPRLIHGSNPISAPEFHSEYEGRDEFDDSIPEVTVYGRIASKRQHGKYFLFVDIVNEFETVQAMVSWQSVEAASKVTKPKFFLFTKLIERGDHISITGRATRTSTGQLSVKATRLPELLSSVKEPIPTVFTDSDKKIQKRHMDMVVNRETTDRLRMRSAIIRYLRNFLENERFLEFQTPILASNAGGAIARPFTTFATEFPSREIALRIAPELWLKRLVVGGVDRVFEIGPAFRNEGIDATHNPEFTICEFYSAYTNLPDLIDRTERLLSGLEQHCHHLISTKLTSLPQPTQGLFQRPFAQVEFIPALEEAIGFRLPDLSSKDALPTLIAALKLGGVRIPGDIPPNLPKLLDRLAALYLEPQSFDKPLFITHHPACMSPLSKSFTCPKTNQEVSARAELFLQGRELGNMYEEENDPDVQQQKLISYRHAALAAARERESPSSYLSDDLDIEEEPLNEQDLEIPPVDLSYLRALNAGLPPTGGWGCGIERLVMHFSGATRISDCMSFGTLKNIIGLTSDGQSRDH